jgi:hypothetical protein
MTAGHLAEPARQHPRHRLLLPLKGRCQGWRNPAEEGGEHMLKHPTEERLAALGLTGMAKALEEQRIERHHNLLIIGKTGVGKSWIACALGHKACPRQSLRPLPSGAQAV